MLVAALLCRRVQAIKCGVGYKISTLFPVPEERLPPQGFVQTDCPGSQSCIYGSLNPHGYYGSLGSATFAFCDGNIVANYLVTCEHQLNNCTTTEITSATLPFWKLGFDIKFCCCDPSDLCNCDVHESYYAEKPYCPSAPTNATSTRQPLTSLSTSSSQLLTTMIDTIQPLLSSTTTKTAPLLPSRKLPHHPIPHNHPDRTAAFP
ncbi:unnamed protein product [Anisakis simplex]|uniref:UPAR/Ly6 domain-containing protein n=1 Tax=Anisakis simplex TaxID=6269 RepID=A0A0M3K088_ANISI|nr:unnamed protein product [Anisakis simplex]